MASCLDIVVVSPSLLQNVAIHPVSPRFSLGMEKWADGCLESLEQSLSASLAGKDDCFGDYDPKSHPPTSARVLLLQPHPQPCCSSVSSRSQPNLQEPPAKKCRFTTLSNKELERLSKACVPKNTESSTKWALENSKSWMSERNNQKCPDSLLEHMDPTHLHVDKWLSAFVAETRKVNGDPYPPTSLHLLLSALQRHMKSIDSGRAPNIFAKDNPSFQTLYRTMDSVYNLKSK